MTTKEKAKLIKQAGKIYTLGLTVERRREKLRQLVQKKKKSVSLYVFM